MSEIHSRERFDQQDRISYTDDTALGLSTDLIRRISARHNEPNWMLAHRLQCFEVYQSKTLPTWGPDLSGLDLESIRYYAEADGSSSARTWDDVPPTIKKTFDRLGIPEAERSMLAGVGAQYDSAVVYHSIREELRTQGVVFMDMADALREHGDIIRWKFMTCVSMHDHIFAALHGAVWSGGTFLWVPRGVRIDEPLQAYFRMNARSGGQFEHTMILLEDDASVHYIEGCSAPRYGTSSLHAGLVEIWVGRRSHMRYSSVENWSIDTYNLNTKRAIVEEDGAIEWVGGNLGSGVTMLYPCSILRWDRSTASHTGIAVAHAGQTVDTGAKVIHIGQGTRSEVISKSISRDSGVSTYRGLLSIRPSATGAIARIDCSALVLDDHSRSDTIPTIRVDTTDAVVSHEASAGTIREDILWALRSRGMDEASARTMIVNGFVSPVLRELPLEYATELNTLIEMEMEDGVG